MTRSDVNLRLVDLAATVFERPASTFADTLVANDVPLWDSLNHVRLLMLIEEALDLRFGNEALHDPQTWGEFVDMVAAKVATRP